jgi:meso-butanediol dehydrogenase/(S,S)-butanediol dehydrogenase/diacetyl reductase
MTTDSTLAPVVLITGASSGIGEACARLFHSRGYRVAASSNEPADGTKLEDLLNFSRPGTAIFLECDVRRRDEIEAMVSRAAGKFGRIDVLINNVGYNSPGKTLDQQSWEEIDDLLAVNLLSCILVTRAALPHLRKSAGSIVNTGSLAGTLGHERLAVYCAAKGGVASFSKGLAIDEAESGVRVNTVVPGNILTASRKRLEDSMPEAVGREFHERVESWQWMGRSGHPIEVANACLFLGGADASFITGAEIVVGGGADLGFGPKRVTNHVPKQMTTSANSRLPEENR